MVGTGVTGACGVRAEEHQQHRRELCLVFGASWCVEVGTGCGRGCGCGRSSIGSSGEKGRSALVCLVLEVFGGKSISSFGSSGLRGMLVGWGGDCWVLDEDSSARERADADDASWVNRR